MVDFEIVNVVGTISYQQEFDLSELAKSFNQRKEIDSVTYEPSNNHWLQTNFSPTNTYVPFYRNGKCSIVGAKSIEEFYSTVSRVNEVMYDLLNYEYEPDDQIKNIVGTTKVHLDLSLENLAIELGLEETEYEPEQFPSLIYHTKDSTLLVFSNGKIVCTGIRHLEKLESKLSEFSQNLRQINKRYKNG